MSYPGEEIPAVAGSEQGVGCVPKMIARAAILLSMLAIPGAVFAHGGGGQAQVQRAATERGLTDIDSDGMRIVDTDCPPNYPIEFSADGKDSQRHQVLVLGCSDMFGLTVVSDRNPQE